MHLSLFFSLMMLFSLLTPLSANATQLIKVPALISHNHTISEYMLQALQLALKKTEAEYGVSKLTHHNLPMSQMRQLASVNKGEMDIAWTIYSPSKTAEYTAVLFPTFAGLSSYRVLLINQDRDFSSINTKAQLQSLLAVQSKTWRDYEVLKRQQFKVQDGGYLLGFNLLQRGFVDYYPRSLLEVKEELKIYKHLKAAPNIAMYYASFMVFFTDPNKPQLNKRIKQGLELASQDGSLSALLKKQGFYREYIEFIKGKTIIQVQPEHDSINEQLANHAFTQLIN